MQGFLAQLSDTIIEKHSQKLHDILIIFPNKRAGLFLKKLFIQKLENSTLLPEILTIEEAFESWSNVSLADPLSIHFELLSLKAEAKNNENHNISEFAGLAVQMAEEFNEIDHQMVDTEALFSYLKEAKALEMWHPDGSALTESEKKYLYFFKQLKTDYQYLNAQLKSKGLAYAGKIARELAEMPEEELNKSIAYEKIIFAGFNAFTKAEATIVNKLLRTKKAEIYWDIDHYYIDKQFFGLHEAGNAIRSFLREMPDSGEIYFISNNLLNKNYNFVFHPLTADVLQAKALGQELSVKTDPQATIVLADENLLQPVLNSIPSAYEHFNVTLGVPLNKTSVFQFIRLYLEFHLTLLKFSEGEIYLKPLLKMLSHECVNSLLPQKTFQDLSAWRSKLIQSGKKFALPDYLLQTAGNESLKIFLAQILQPIDKSAAGQFNTIKSFLALLEQLLRENNSSGSVLLEHQLSLIVRIFNKLESLLTAHFPENDFASVVSLFTGIATAQKVNFKGEPLQGLQIMGLLETRNLSFPSIHLLSINEGILPRKQSKQSLIPSDIRKTFNLPSFSDKQAITAYHFYRLIQHADNIHLYYNAESGDFGSGEASRYIKQIIHELAVANPKVHLRYQNFGLNQSKENFTSSITIQKSEEVLRQLQEKAIKGFSPSGLTHYIECPLKFYFSDVLRMKSTEKFSEAIQYNVLGTIVHETLELLFKPIIGQNLNKDILDGIIAQSSKVLENCINKSIPGGLGDQGNSLITKEVAYQFVNNFLKQEKSDLDPANPVNIKKLEYELENTFLVQNQQVKLKGTIDRIDQKGSHYRLIDYKTGKVETSQVKLKSWEEMLDKSKTKALQLALYWLLIHYSDLSFAKANISCGIVSLQKTRSGLFTLELPDICEESINQIEKHFLDLITEILDPEIPIKQTEDLKLCKTCDYAGICNR